MTITPRRPSELPRVLMVATIGFNSQMLANFRARSVDMVFPAEGERRTRTISHPAMMSARLKITFPNENHPAEPCHVVGRSIQARRGV